MVVGTLVACGFVVGVGYLSYALACRLCPDRSGSARLACAAVFAYAVSVASFLLLAFADLLNVWALATLAAGLIAVTAQERGSIRRHFAEDRAAIAGWWGAARGAHLQWPLAGICVVVGVRFVRALASPPQATDALTYHLFRAGQWAQAGRLVHAPAPDAWGYYDYYPIAGDGLWALVMTTTSGDTWLGLAQALVFATLALGGYAAARSLGTGRRTSTLVTATICTIPSVLVFSASAYLDGMVLALFLLGIAALFGAGARGLGVAVLAFALAASVKLTGVPLLALGLLAAAYRSAFHFRGEAKGALVLLALAGFVLAAPPYVRGWLEWQNPLYPFGLSVGGTEIWAGNMENALLQTGALAPPELTKFDPLEFSRTLFVPRADLAVQHLNLGPALPLLLVTAAWGLVRVVRHSGQRAAAVLLVVLVAVFGWRLFGDSMLAHRTFAAPAVGRNLAVPAACIVLLAGLGARRIFVGLSWIAIVSGLVLGFPRGLSPGEATIAALVFLLLLGVLAVARGTAGLLSVPKVWVRLLVGSVVLALLAPVLELLRTKARYRVYAEAVDAVAFDPHPTDPRAAQAWPLWEYLDAKDGLRIAYSAGWDGRGHNWYRTPVLGRRLQNEVVYVPPTGDGEIIDYREHDRLVRNLEVGSWVLRLRAEEVDYVLLAAPPPVETVWTEGVPDVFTLERQAGPHRLYRVSLPAIDARLASGGRPPGT